MMWIQIVQMLLGWLGYVSTYSRQRSAMIDGDPPCVGEATGLANAIFNSFIAQQAAMTLKLCNSIL